MPPLVRERLCAERTSATQDQMCRAGTVTPLLCERLCAERGRGPRLQENDSHADLRVWTERKKGKNRIHIWHHAEDYVVVISERKGFYIPWTAFFVNYKNYRIKLE